MLLSHDTDDDWEVDFAALADSMVDTVHIFQSPNGAWWWRRVAPNRHTICQSTRSYSARHRALQHALRVNRKPFIVTADGPQRPDSDDPCPVITPQTAPWASTSA